MDSYGAEDVSGDLSIKVPNSGSAGVDAESVLTEAGAVARQRVAISGDLAIRLVTALEALVDEQRLTNALLKQEFRSGLTIHDLRRP